MPQYEIKCSVDFFYYVEADNEDIAIDLARERAELEIMEDMRYSSMVDFNTEYRLLDTPVDEDSIDIKQSDEEQ